jgi:hypothetical protein
MLPLLRFSFRCGGSLTGFVRALRLFFSIRASSEFNLATRTRHGGYALTAVDRSQFDVPVPPEPFSRGIPPFTLPPVRADGARSFTLPGFSFISRAGGSLTGFVRAADFFFSIVASNRLQALRS